MQRGSEDSKLAQRLRAPGTVFFLHLLGLDTTGHGYGPHSEVRLICRMCRFGYVLTSQDRYGQEYIRNIQYVDELVRKVEQEMSSFYQDERTAYLFT